MITVFMISLSHIFRQVNTSNFILNYKRAFLPLLLMVAFVTPQTHELVVNVLADAFLQVTAFVAITLLLYYKLSKHIPYLELSYVKEHAPHLELPIAAFLGALPGCGGAIIVVTQFTKKQASFGSVVAVLTATMGDAAFLLLAKRPLDGILILTLSFFVGWISGTLVNRFSKEDHFPQMKSECRECDQKVSNFGLLNKTSIYFWKIAAIPVFVLALLFAFQFDFSVISPNAENHIIYFGAASGLLVTILWGFSSKGETYQDVTAEDKDTNSMITKVIKDTHFVTAWVVAAFLLYEIAVTFFALDLAQWFKTYAVFAPLVGAVIGLLPGCGPQIVVTTLYIQGIIPFSALLANAISNDGDALFPAIALAPKAALLATLYSTIPAICIAYFVYFLF